MLSDSVQLSVNLVIKWEKSQPEPRLKATMAGKTVAPRTRIEKTADKLILGARGRVFRKLRNGEL